MRKLYAYVEKHHGVMGPSDLAQYANISPQRISNWQSRGISKEGALMMQLLLGINAIDLLDPELTAAVKEPKVPYKARVRPKP
jgi:ABC-type arginine transport system ATPase subunit